MNTDQKESEDSSISYAAVENRSLRSMERKLVSQPSRDFGKQESMRKSLFEDVAKNDKIRQIEAEHERLDERKEQIKLEKEAIKQKEEALKCFLFEYDKIIQKLITNKATARKKVVTAEKQKEEIDKMIETKRKETEDLKETLKQLKKRIKEKEKFEAFIAIGSGVETAKETKEAVLRFNTCKSLKKNLDTKLITVFEQKQTLKQLGKIIRSQREDELCDMQNQLGTLRTKEDHMNKLNDLNEERVTIIKELHRKRSQLFSQQTVIDNWYTTFGVHKHHNPDISDKLAFIKWYFMDTLEVLKELFEEGLPDQDPFDPDLTAGSIGLVTQKPSTLKQRKSKGHIYSDKTVSMKSKLNICM